MISNSKLKRRRKTVMRLRAGTMNLKQQNKTVRSLLDLDGLLILSLQPHLFSQNTPIPLQLIYALLLRPSLHRPSTRKENDVVSGKKVDQNLKACSNWLNCLLGGLLYHDPLPNWLSGHRTLNRSSPLLLYSVALEV